MKRVLLTLAFAALAAAGGCAAPASPGTSVSVDEPNQVLALLSVADRPVASSGEHVNFRLGAGDSLGQTLIVTYMAHARANNEHARFAAVKVE